MNILIADDDKIYLETLKTHVEGICRAHRIDVVVTVTEDAVSVIDDGRYKYADVILLDIDMPAVSGIEIASRLNRIKGTSERPYIIFVTGRDGMVFEALKRQPYSFVRKSDIGDLEPCLLRIAERLSADRSYVIHDGRKTAALPMDEIICLEKHKNYVVFYTTGGEYRERSRIDDKYRDLSPYGFLRIHIGGLVNPRYIRAIRQDNVELKDGRRLPLSKKYRAQATEAFYDWMMNLL